MDDLISRQAAVDAVNDLAKWYCETYHETRPTVMAVIDMLERLPSEQLEKTQLSEEDTISDCISRQAAIDILYNFAGCVVDTPNGDYRRAYEASRHELETLPSAQPNLQQTCNKLATDCISRQAAIDAMEDVDWYHINKDGQLTHGANSKEDEPLYKAKDVYKVLNDMPSAQPYLQQTCNQLETDTISRQTAIDAFEDTTFTKNEIRRRLSELPPAQPVHNTGKWVRGTYHGFGIYNWTCKCGHVVVASVPDRFCGACGCDNAERRTDEGD